MEIIFNNVVDEHYLLQPGVNNKYGLVANGNNWEPTTDVVLFTTGNVKTIDGVYLNRDITMSDYDYDTH